MGKTITVTTAEEFLRLNDGQRSELVRGRVVPLNMPGPRHGEVCMQIGFLLKQYLKTHDIGHVMGNDTGVVTQRDPDTVRGADVAFISYERAPKGKLPEQYLDESPEIVFEVLSPRNREEETLAKMGELIAARVLYVCVVNPGDEEVGVFMKDSPKGRWLRGDEMLTFEDILPGFGVPVREVFE